MKLSHRSLIYILLFFVISLMCGCSFSKLKKELAEMDETFALQGKITGGSSPQENLLVLLYEKAPAGPEISKLSIVEEGSGYYSIEVPQGVYFIVAFEDTNDNLTYDADEAIGYYGKPDAVRVARGLMPAETPRSRKGLDFTVDSSNRFPPGFPSEINVTPDQIQESGIKVGRLTVLEDEIFSPQNGAKGYWEPLTFLREVGAGVYFLEKYDAHKTPILLIHGALGTPRGWKALIDHLDRRQYQPWLFYYPSGLALDKIGKWLNLMIDSLERSYGFEELFVIAHSMGGLVARSFIIQNYQEGRQHYLKLFISISTPWNGHRMAAKGVKHAPTVVPSWYDMEPESNFIQSIFREKLPDYLKYYLLFSYKGDCSLFLANNDGTVELASELDVRAQSEAKKVFGYDEDHGSILTSEGVITQINQLMDYHNGIRNSLRMPEIDIRSDVNAVYGSLQ
jgi:pimeloyl-ACP methyl ester carboxylesterase